MAGVEDKATQFCSPPEPKGIPILYRGIRQWFRGCAAGFYATTEVHGLLNMPPPGSPTILCFNHGNGLADPLVIIRKTPRMVRFCAKDTLWSIPVMKYFVRNSGAVPVYRAREHGDKARDMNLEVFAKVIGGLREGDCIGFAPEGVSRFLPYMEQPLKVRCRRRRRARARAR
jgi:glycerol-3-phosphate O-acyltransferase/dihydroxyacetone phosphate acyltransferase